VYPNSLYRIPSGSACLVVEYQVVACLFDLEEVFGMIIRLVPIRQWEGVCKAETVVTYDREMNQSHCTVVA